MSIETFARPLARRTAIWREPTTSFALIDADDTIDLSASYLLERAPAHIGQGAQDALDRGETHYVDRLGIKPLREAIVATLARDGIPNVTADNVLVTSGAQEALFIALRALVQPHDGILVPDPGYGLIQPLAELGDGVVVSVASAANNFEITAAAYAAAITPHSRFLVVLSPNPATCKVIAPGEFAKLLALAEQHNLVILYDAALSAGIYTPTADPNFADGIPDRVLLIGSASKLYRMGGWRIGWIAGNTARLKSLRDLKQALSICSASLSQWAAVAALTGPQEWLSAQQSGFVTKRDDALGALAAMGLPVVKPEAAYYVWIDVRPSGLTANEFAAFALQQARVVVTPGTAFGTAGEGYVRISLAASREQVKAGLERLQNVPVGLKR